MMPDSHCLGILCGILHIFEMVSNNNLFCAFEPMTYINHRNLQCFIAHYHRNVHPLEHPFCWLITP